MGLLNNAKPTNINRDEVDVSLDKFSFSKLNTEDNSSVKNVENISGASVEDVDLDNLLFTKEGDTQTTDLLDAYESRQGDASSTVSENSSTSISNRNNSSSYHTSDDVDFSTFGVTGTANQVDSSVPSVRANSSSDLYSYGEGNSGNIPSPVDTPLGSMGEGNTSFDSVTMENPNDSSIVNDVDEEFPNYYLSEEQIESFLGQMSEDEYNDFIAGIQSYYDEQISAYDDILDDLTGVYDDLSGLENSFSDEYESNETYKQNLIYEYIQSQIDAGKIVYDESSADEDSIVISYDEYTKFLSEMTDEEQYEWIKKNFPDDEQLIGMYESYLNSYDVMYDELLTQYEAMGYSIEENQYFSSFKEFKQYVAELKNAIDYVSYYQNEAINRRNSAYYDYLVYRDDYDEFSSVHFDEPTEEECNDFAESWYDNGYSYLVYAEKHPDCSPLEYMLLAKHVVGVDNLCFVKGISNATELSELVEISDYSPELLMAYTYAYNTGGDKDAAAFLKTNEYQINNIKGQIMAQEFLSTLSTSEDPMSAVLNSLGVDAQGLRDGLDTFGSGVTYSIEAFRTLLGFDEENRCMSAEEYKKMYILNALLSEEQKISNGVLTVDDDGNVVNAFNGPIDFTQEYTGLFLDEQYEIFQGIGNMIPSICISYINPLAGSIAMGVSAGGNGYHQAMVGGNSLLSSFAYGVFTGFSESVSERILGAIPGLSDFEVTSFRTFLEASGREGVQEMFQGVVDKAYQCAFMGEDVPSTPEEWEAFAKDIGKQGLYGAITAGIMNGVVASPRLLNYLLTDFSSFDTSEILYEFNNSSNKEGFFKSLLRKLHLFQNNQNNLVNYQNTVSNLPFQQEINGIVFASDTQEGLDNLLTYYMNIYNSADAGARAYIDSLSGKGLIITNVNPFKTDVSFNYLNIVYFATNTMTNNQFGTFFHEPGHFLDGYWTSNVIQGRFEDVITYLQDNFDSLGISLNMKEFLNDYQAFKNEIYETLNSNTAADMKNIEQELRNKYADFDRWPTSKQQRMIADAYDKYRKSFVDTAMRDSGFSAVSDIFDALSGGYLHSNEGMFGHGTEYYKNTDLVYKEILANLSDLYNRGKLDLLTKYLPNSDVMAMVGLFEEILGVQNLKTSIDNAVQNGSVSYNIQSAILEYLKTHDSSTLSGNEELKRLIVTCSDSMLKQYLTSYAVMNDFMLNSQKIHDSKYGDGSFKAGLENYLKTGNLNSITREGHVREYIQMLSKEQISLIISSL